jgi:hypothetical protein
MGVRAVALARPTDRFHAAAIVEPLAGPLDFVEARLEARLVPRLGDEMLAESLVSLAGPSSVFRPPSPSSVLGARVGGGRPSISTSSMPSNGLPNSFADIALVF